MLFALHPWVAPDTRNENRHRVQMQHVAPIRERPTITVQEAVARRMRKLRAKLGITNADLAPASVALEAEHRSANPGVKGANPCGQDGDRVVASSDRVLPEEVDIGGWKKEAEDMLDLLRPNAGRAHEYPLVELKRKKVMKKVEEGEASDSSAASVI